MKDNVVYIELNNWFSGRDYPIHSKLYEWVNQYKFRDEEWVKEQKLVVVCGPVDMSFNMCITAPKEWVEKNCPEMLSDKSYDYNVHRYSAGIDEVVVEHRAYKDFLRFPDEYSEIPIGRYKMPFMEYTEENIGVHWSDAYYDYEEDFEDDEE